MAFVALLLPSVVQSQVDYDILKKATNKIFIKDVIIHDRPGSSIEYGSILIDDGIIQQIGKGIAEPKDALILKADSLHVYPAFIDALSHTGVKNKEENEKRPNVKFAGSPPNVVAGILPQLSVVDQLESDAKSISSLREAGFGLAHVAPDGRMLPGQSAIISTSGKALKDIVLKERVGLYSQLKSSPGVYPATMIGVISKFKELYRQAEGASVHIGKYKSSPLGMQRPNYDEAIIAMIPVTKKQQQVFYKAKSAKDVYRVLALQKELGFDLVLSDVQQVYPIVDAIKSSNAKVLISLDLPEKPEGMKDEENDKAEDEEKEDSEDKDKDKDEKEPEVEDDEETKKFKERKIAAYKNYVAQGSMLEEAGVPFSFSWIEAKPKDLQKNIQTLIENGMSEKTAISALTTNPAQLLGISNIAGTAEKGKLGNLMISTKAIFEKDAKIKFMLVDGELFEYEIKEKKKNSSSGEQMDIAGKYSYEISQFSANGELTIEKDGDEIKVLMSDEEDLSDTIEATNVSQDGSNLSFDLAVTEGGNTMDISVSIEFSEEDFEGTVVTQFGAAEIEGTKKSPKH